MTTKDVITAVAIILPIYTITDTIFDLTFFDQIVCAIGCITGSLISFFVIKPLAQRWIMRKVKNTKYEHIIKYETPREPNGFTCKASTVLKP